MGLKCDRCDVMREIEESKAPSVCAWYMDNIVINGVPKMVIEKVINRRCTAFIPRKEGAHE